MHAVAVAGHVCLDVRPDLPRLPEVVGGQLIEVGPLELRAGGCVSNTGMALVALGADVDVFADIGRDALGDVLRGLLGAAGLGLKGLRTVASTTSYSIVVDPPGLDRTFWHHVGANADFDGTTVGVDGIGLLHIGYPPILPGLITDSAKPLAELLRRARGAGVSTSLDLAVVDPHGPGAALDWHDLFARILPMTDVLSPSVDDLESALGTQIPRTPAGLTAEAQRLVGCGAGVVLLSAGADGMAMATGTRQRLAAGGRAVSSLGDEWREMSAWLPALPLRSARTTGAGDAATAGLLMGILRATPPLAALELARLSAVNRLNAN